MDTDVKRSALIGIARDIGSSFVRQLSDAADDAELDEIGTRLARANELLIAPEAGREYQITVVPAGTVA